MKLRFYLRDCSQGFNLGTRVHVLVNNHGDKGLDILISHFVNLMSHKKVTVPVNIHL